VTMRPRRRSLNDAPCPPFTSHGASILLQFTLADYGHVGGPQGSNFLKHSLMTKAARAARAHLLPPEDCRL
jgi:hypothetical protein